jgi:hypothetical protein
MGPIPSPAIPPRFALHQILDRTHGSVVAGVFEHPPGWVAQTQVGWNFQNVSLPVLVYARAAAPGGLESFELLPIESFYWLEPNYGMLQPGSSLLGQICMRPQPAAEAMSRWVIPKYRGRCPGVKIVSTAPVPELVRLAPEISKASPEGVCAVIEYCEQGRPVEEAFFGLRIGNQVPYSGPQGTTVQLNWGFYRLFSYRAAKGQLVPQRERFWRMAASLRFNPLWDQLCGRVNQQLRAQFQAYLDAGYSQIQAAGQLSRQISMNNDAMLASFAQQRQAAARSQPASPGRSPTDGFDEYIRGVETLKDPYLGTSQQDATYQYHWTNGSGSYQHSNDPFFNPNIGSGLQWTLMEKPAP